MSLIRVCACDIDAILRARPATTPAPGDTASRADPPISNYYVVWWHLGFTLARIPAISCCPFPLAVPPDVSGGVARESALRARCEALEPAHVWLQDPWEADRAVGLLVVFKEGHHRPPDRETGAVQRRARLGAGAAGRSVAEIHSPSSERIIGGTGRDLPVPPLPRQPDLDVVALGRAEAEVARAALDHPIR